MQSSSDIEQLLEHLRLTEQSDQQLVIGNEINNVLLAVAPSHLSNENSNVTLSGLIGLIDYRPDLADPITYAILTNAQCTCNDSLNSLESTCLVRYDHNVSCKAISCPVHGSLVNWNDFIPMALNKADPWMVLSCLRSNPSLFEQCSSIITRHLLQDSMDTNELKSKDSQKNLLVLIESTRMLKDFSDMPIMHLALRHPQLVDCLLTGILMPSITGQLNSNSTEHHYDYLAIFVMHCALRQAEQSKLNKSDCVDDELMSCQ